jgi:hypothetical protein
MESSTDPFKKVSSDDVGGDDIRDDFESKILTEGPTLPLGECGETQKRKGASIGDGLFHLKKLFHSLFFLLE